MPSRSQPDAPTGGTDGLLDTAPAGFLTVDASGMIRLANTTLAAMLGRTTDELVSRHVDTILPPAGRIFFSTHVFPLLRVERVAEEIYIPLRHADGQDVPILVNGRARGSGDQLLFDLVVVPMRQRNQLEGELLSARVAAEQAAAAKDRFVSVVTHELRSPLSVIAGYADLLLRGVVAELEPTQRSYVERIREAARYQAALIDEILEFAAAGSDRDLAPEILSVEEALQRAEAMLSVLAQEQDRPLERTPRPAPGTVHADPRAVQQILLNLGTNALKYGRPRTPIRIAFEAGEKAARISITDQGDGIAEEDRERIFEPFVRLSPSSDGETSKGIGLGLAISRELARAMGGDITVTSALGIGSTFVLELPNG